MARAMERPECKISGSETIWLDMILLVETVVLGHYYYYYFMHKITFAAVIAATLTAAAVLAGYTCYRAVRRADVQTHILAVVFVTFLGPIGGLISVILATFHLIFARSFRGNFSDWLYEYLFALEKREKNSDLIYQRIVSGQEVFETGIDTEPLIDIMDFGTQEQKQAALIKVVKYFRPHLTPILQMGLHDANNLIRVQAAAGLARLQDDFHRKYVRISARLADREATPEELISFAALCEEYSEAGLLDSDRKATALRQSIRVYETVIGMFPDRADLKLSLIRVLLINQDRERADTLLTALLQQIAAPSAEQAAMLLELLWNLGRYREMREYAVAWSENPELADQEWIGLWRGETDRVKMEWLSHEAG